MLQKIIFIRIIEPKADRCHVQSLYSLASMPQVSRNRPFKKFFSCMTSYKKQKRFSPSLSPAEAVIRLVTRLCYF